MKMKFQNIILGASLLGLITFFLPVVTDQGSSIAPVSEYVADYIGAPSVFLLFLVWYGAFVLTLVLSLIPINAFPNNKIRLVLIVVLNLFALFIHNTLTKELVGNTSLGFGGMLYYLCAIVNIVCCIMLFKNSDLNINKEDLKKVADKGMVIGKATATVATKVAKTTMSEVKKELDKHKSDPEQ